MFVNNINPVMVKIGFLEIRYYSMAYILGFVLSYFILLHYIKRNMIQNMDKDKLDSYLIYVIIGTIAGARAGYFFTKEINPFSHLIDIFKVWQGGMSFHGGLIGIVLVTLFFCWKYKVKFYDLADVLVVPGALALFLGRIMNFVNGELVGIKTNVSWCFQFKYYEGCRHPSQLYEALKNLFIFFILLALYNKKDRKEYKPGTLFWVFVLMYGFLRFVITFLRDDPGTYGLSGGQWLSLLMFVIAVIVLTRRQKK